jgi:hypothetical protein
MNSPIDRLVLLPPVQFVALARPDWCAYQALRRLDAFLLRALCRGRALGQLRRDSEPADLRRRQVSSQVAILEKARR